MRTLLICMLCAVTAYAQYDSSPVPPRLIIPGAAPIGGFRPTDYRQGRLQQAVPVRLQQQPAPARIRRPGLARPSFKSVEPTPQRPNLQSLEDAPAKPVTEEPEDDLIEINTPTTLGFAPSFFATTQQQNDFYDITTTSQPKPPSAYNSPTPQPFLQPTIQPFRPEILQNNRPTQQFYRPQQFAPIIRNEPPQQQQQAIKTPVRITPLSSRPQRPSYRPEPKPFLEEEEPAPIQPQPARHHARPIDPIRTPVKSLPIQKYTPSNPKEKKPVAQILRKYRDENPDGSITWGFENDDGSFKEETIGIDCVTRGKYGYVDPDGLKREYNYETGIPCDRSKEDQEEKGFIDYQENRAVLPNGVTIDLAAMGKKSKRPLRSPHKS